MKTGRPPKATVIKLLQKTLKPSRTNPDEPDAKLGAPERPKYLKGAARKEWDRLIPYLTSTGVLAEQEQGSLAMLCLLHGKMVEAAKRNELLTAAMIAQYRNLAAVFGLTPADRVRVKGTKAKTTVNEWDSIASNG